MKSASDLQEEFENSLKQSSWWSRLIGSQFVGYISSFVGQAAFRVTTASQRALQESFLSLATRRASILAGAEDRAYVGLKISPSKGVATITNTSNKRLSLPKNSPCIAENLAEYIILPAVDLEPNKSIDVEVSQLWLERVRVIADETPWFSVLLTKELTAEAHRVDVYVNGVLWEQKFKFRNTNKDSRAYMEFYKATDQLGFRFGNGINGKIPPKGAVITLNVWCTNGVSTLIDNQALKLTDENEFATAALDIKTKTPITGGAPAADIEAIRNGSLYLTSYDHQLAWDGDYHSFVMTNVGGIIWLSVWGEKQQEQLDGVKKLENMNTIFFSAYSDIKSDEKLSSEIQTLFDGREGYNEVYRWVDRVDLPFTINLRAYTFLNSRPTDAEIYLKAQLEAKFGKNVKGKPARIYIQDIWDVINDLAGNCGVDEFKIDSTTLPSTVNIGSYSYLDVENSQFDIRYGNERTGDFQ